MAEPLSAEEQFYSPERVGELFDVTPETVIKWIKRGILGGNKIGGLWRIPRSAVIALGNSKYGAPKS